MFNHKLNLINRDIKTDTLKMTVLKNNFGPSNGSETILHLKTLSFPFTVLSKTFAEPARLC